MTHPKIVEFPMPRPKICRTQEEVDRVPRHLPIQVEVEFPLSTTAQKTTARVLAKALDAAETELLRVTKRVEHLRRLHGDYRPATAL
jgi:hypothetical protein